LKFSAHTHCCPEREAVGGLPKNKITVFETQMGLGLQVIIRVDGKEEGQEKYSSYN
jgi:hypothetical protein